MTKPLRPHSFFRSFMGFALGSATEFMVEDSVKQSSPGVFHTVAPAHGSFQRDAPVAYK